MVFKRPKRSTTVWTVVDVQLDPEKVTWTNKGATPNYIKLRGEVNGKEIECWTCENKLRPHFER